LLILLDERFSNRGFVKGLGQRAIFGLLGSKVRFGSRIDLQHPAVPRLLCADEPTLSSERRLCVLEWT